MTIERKVKSFFVTLILASSILTAEAQTTQSTNQIVRQETAQPAAKQQAATSQTPASQDQAPAQKSAPQQASESERATVIPPAPVVIKRDPDLVTIPLADLPPGSNSNSAIPESKYEGRPVASNEVKIGSLYGYRRDPFTGRARFHSGLDIKARWGEPVGASLAGTVQFAGWYYGYGQLLIINHGGGVTTHYAHLSSFKAEVGARVRRGEVIGYAGSTGRATSPHLHYEVRIDGKYVNPLQPLALDPSSEYFNQQRPDLKAPVIKAPEIKASDVLISRPDPIKN